MGGFDFSNYARNAELQKRGFPQPQATSTGTTIVGCIFNGGVVIAAGQLVIVFWELMREACVGPGE